MCVLLVLLSTIWLDFPQLDKKYQAVSTCILVSQKLLESQFEANLNISVEPAFPWWRVEVAGSTFQSITTVIFRVSREDWTRTSFHRSSAVHLRLVDYQSVYAVRVLPVASPFPCNRITIPLV